MKKIIVLISILIIIGLIYILYYNHTLNNTKYSEGDIDLNKVDIDVDKGDTDKSKIDIDERKVNVISKDSISLPSGK